jgi:hypothetical protein
MKVHQPDPGLHPAGICRGVCPLLLPVGEKLLLTDFIAEGDVWQLQKAQHSLQANIEAAVA